MPGFRLFTAILLLASPGVANADYKESVLRLGVAYGHASAMAKSEARASPSDSDIISASKALCRAGLVCLWFTGNSSANGFVFERPDQILTTLEPFSRFLKGYWELVDPERLEDIPVSLTIARGEKIVFGQKETDVATITVSAEARQAIQSSSDSLHPNQALNVAVLRLSRGVGNPLALATKDPDTLSVAGYATTNTPEFNVVSGQNAKPGSILYVSPDGLGLVPFANYPPTILRGAPIMNDRSEVVGIHLGQMDGMSIYRSLLYSPLLYRYPTTAIEGTESANVIRSEQECRTLCVTRSGCAGFMHTTIGNQCRIYSSVGSAKVDKGSFTETRELVGGYSDPTNR
ncbi:hypothetical protein GOB57_08045 [Sinorhizobium meliloti]|nr:hypothetical protein [Sinorhizobium meliloti]